MSRQKDLLREIAAALSSQGERRITEWFVSPRTGAYRFGESGPKRSFSFAEDRLDCVIRDTTLDRIWFCCLLAPFQTICLEPQDAFGPTVPTIDEVGPTRFVAHQPDVVPDISLGETAIRHERWWRTVVDWLTNGLRQDGNLIQHGLLR